jgi:hypothetical protein
MRFVLLACIAMLSMGYGAVYEDMNIRTWIVPLTGIDLKTDWYITKYVNTAPPGFANDKVVGTKTVVYSDPKPNNKGKEVFNFVRQSGAPQVSNGTYAKYRSGGWSHVFAFDNVYSDKLFIELNRKSGGTGDFYAADFPTINWLAPNARSFTDRTQRRGAVKVEYVCMACPAPSTNVIWKKIGPWQMEKRFNKHSLSLTISSDVPSLNIVDMTAAMHSDPFSSGKVWVDDIEHTGPMRGITGEKELRRGGILWYGYGCNGGKDCAGDIPSAGIHHLHLYGGPNSRPFQSGEPGSSYSLGAYFIGSEKILVPYASSTQNRGWARIEYTGTKSSFAVPYAVKTKAMDIGPWDMTTAPYRKEIPFSTLGIAANRVMRLTTVIRSDYSSQCGTGPTCEAGYQYTNFHAPQTSSGEESGPDDEGYGGGNTFIDESRNVIGLYLTNVLSTYASRISGAGYFRSGNRGSVLVDYLAGSCEQGPSGFKIQGIPGTQVGDCGATAPTFALEGSGQDIWNASDNFSYAYKAGAGDRDLQIKVESMDYTDGWARAGIMFRANLNANSAHASMVITPNKSGVTSNGARFTYRLGNGASTSHSAANTFAPPYFIRIKKVGKTFTAYYRSPSTSTWTQAGTPQTINDFGTTYYYGLAQTSKTAALNKATFSGMTMSPTGW